MKTEPDFLDFLESLFGKEFVAKYVNENMSNLANKAPKAPKMDNKASENKFMEKPKDSTEITKVEDNRYSGYILEVVKEDGVKTGVKLKFCVVGLTKDQIEITECDRIITVKSSVEVPYGFGFINQRTKIGDIYDLTKITTKMENGELVIYAPVSKDKCVKSRKISIG